MKFAYISFLSTVALSLFISCTNAGKDNQTELKNSSIFSEVMPDKSGITFNNTMTQTMEFNFMNYMYIYTGAGVASGDIDNDGFADIYFVSNTGPNKLYKNKGGFIFEDITVKSKTEDYKGFSTGVGMWDINGDGWLDIYVCKAGSLTDNDARRNLVFLNNQDGTFTESAKLVGLDDPGFSTQAYPIDYDMDGDLDVYVVNHRYDFQNNTVISGEIQSAIEETTSDHLYRNEGNRFTKVTGEAGLYSKTWGLSASIGDFNNDNWPDIYVANDFFEPDFLYINQKDGTFRNEINQRMKHISLFSMGTDYADLNNDLQNDLISLDMVSESHVKNKENMVSMDIPKFFKMVEIGYHHQYMTNTLHWGTSHGIFQETAQLSGIANTDWSWAPLIADFDNDGFKDIFVSNGIDREYTNQDARRYLKSVMARGESMTLDSLLNTFPSAPIPNYIFHNNGNLTFEKKTTDWGLKTPTYSYGASYADLDNDGDLDLITNNLNSPCSIYENTGKNNYLSISLEGSASNTFGLGAKLILETTNGYQSQELYTHRGYESSIPPVAHFGLGSENTAKKLWVQWPDGKVSEVDNITVNQHLRLRYDQATNDRLSLNLPNSLLTTIDPASLGISFRHQENPFDDYNLQLLLPQKQSTKGTRIASGDINGDGLDDFFVGNASGMVAATYLQTTSGTFKATNQSLWMKEAAFEDANALFFDADGDGDNDLYVVSAGYNLDQESPLLQDRLYINDGNGNFTKRNSALPSMRISGKAIATADYDGDGDLDLFIGGNVIPGKYPLAPQSYLLKNEGGTFVDATPNNAELSEIGMISDAVFTDYDQDGDLDLMVIGEWMSPTFFTNNQGSFTKNIAVVGLDQTEGWWFDITAADFDGDGDDDYVLGNLGGSNKFRPSAKKPLYISAKDFDDNGSFDVAMSKIFKGKIVPVRGKECSSQQNPFLLDKIQSYGEFAHSEFKDIYGEDELKDAFQKTVHILESAYLENLGNGNFELRKLPIVAQTGPTMASIAIDINGDGNLDILGAGGLYDAEVETIRYDANFGYVLMGDGQGNFTPSQIYQPFLDMDTKDVKTITIAGRTSFIAVGNNAPLEIFTYKP